MTTQTLSALPSLYILNPNIDKIALHDNLHGHLDKLSAFTHLGLSDDFLDYPKPTIYHYLSPLNDFVRNIQEIVHAIEKCELE